MRHESMSKDEHGIFRVLTPRGTGHKSRNAQPQLYPVELQQ